MELMSARDRPGRSDPDDWFADLDEAAPASRTRATLPTPEHQLQLHEPGDTHEWRNAETGPGETPASASGFTITLGALLAIAAVALAVVVLVVLALSGVFSGSSRHPATATTTAQLTRPTTTTTSPSTAPATSPAQSTRPRDSPTDRHAATRRPGSPGQAAATGAQTTRLPEQPGRRHLRHLNPERTHGAPTSVARTRRRHPRPSNPARPR